MKEFVEYTSLYSMTELLGKPVLFANNHFSLGLSILKPAELLRDQQYLVSLLKLALFQGNKNLSPTLNTFSKCICCFHYSCSSRIDQKQVSNESLFEEIPALDNAGMAGTSCV
jgi:hypothetical protein